jgi:hypothetical protein
VTLGRQIEQWELDRSVPMYRLYRGHDIIMVLLTVGACSARLGNDKCLEKFDRKKISQLTDR